MPKFKHWPHVNKGWKEVKREMISDPAGGPGLERIWRQRTFGQIKYAQAFFNELERLEKIAARFKRLGRRIPRFLHVKAQSTSPSVQKFLKGKGVKVEKEKLGIPTKAAREQIAGTIKKTRKLGQTGKAMGQVIDTPSKAQLAVAGPALTVGQLISPAPMAATTLGVGAMTVPRIPEIARRRKQYIAAQKRQAAKGK